MRKADTAQVWEGMVQVMVWLLHLLDAGMVDTEDVENLAEFCRTLLERVGSRPNMEFTLTWLAGSRMALMKLSGIPTMEMVLSPDSLFEKRDETVRGMLVSWQGTTLRPIDQRLGFSLLFEATSSGN